MCEGIAAFARSRPDWRLTLCEDGIPSRAKLADYDGFIWSVGEVRTAVRLTETGRPVVDIVNDGKYAGTVSVGADHLVCGRLAARHFLAHRMSRFAFLGWKGLRFSDAREQAFVSALREDGYSCAVYRAPVTTMQEYLDDNVQRERFVLPADRRAISRWISSLPKPVAVFCANDLRAWQLNAICAELGLSVPGDVAILGADNDSVPCLFTNPTLSSVDTDAIGTGRAAAETLDALMRAAPHERSAKPVLVNPIGVECRESTMVYSVDPPWLAEALRFIHENVARALLASEVAEFVHRSYVTLENAFREKLGTTVQNVIMNSRLERAEHLLRHSTYSMKDVAELAGFGSAQYFNQCFRRRYGVSPGAYRQNPPPPPPWYFTIELTDFTIAFVDAKCYTSGRNVDLIRNREFWLCGKGFLILFVRRCACWASLRCRPNLLRRRTLFSIRSSCRIGRIRRFGTAKTGSSIRLPLG